VKSPGFSLTISTGVPARSLCVAKGSCAERLPVADRRLVARWLHILRHSRLPRACRYGRYSFGSRRPSSRPSVSQGVAPRCGDRRSTPPASEHIHAHRLRHTAATTDAEGGAHRYRKSVSFLRHRRALTTRDLRPRVDREALRTIAPLLAGRCPHEPSSQSPRRLPGHASHPRLQNLLEPKSSLPQFSSLTLRIAAKSI